MFSLLSPSNMMQRYPYEDFEPTAEQSQPNLSRYRLFFYSKTALWIPDFEDLYPKDSPYISTLTSVMENRMALPLIVLRNLNQSRASELCRSQQKARGRG